MNQKSTARNSTVSVGSFRCLDAHVCVYIHVPRYKHRYVDTHKTYYLALSDAGLCVYIQILLHTEYNRLSLKP